MGKRSSPYRTRSSVGLGVILVVLLLSCVSLAKNFGEGVDNTTYSTLYVANYNWNRATVTLMCRDAPSTPKIRVDFNAKESRRYKNFDCGAAYILVSLAANSGTWFSHSFPVNFNENICLDIKTSLHLSIAYPCASS